MAWIVATAMAVAGVFLYTMGAWSESQAFWGIFFGCIGLILANAFATILRPVANMSRAGKVIIFLTIVVLPLEGFLIVRLLT